MIQDEMMKNEEQQDTEGPEEVQLARERERVDVVLTGERAQSL